MTSLKAYKELLLKVNKNDTNANIHVPKSQFVLIFNEQKRIWLDEKVKDKENNDYIEDIQELLVPDVSLKKLSSSTLKDEFELPADFFRRCTSYSVASKDTCKNVVLVNWPVKPKDINVLLVNTDTNPSFEYQETLYMVAGNKLLVYKDNFNLDEVYLTYYKEPRDIDLEGYTHIDGEPSTNIDTELSDFNVNQIIDRVAVEILFNYESREQAQAAVQRIQLNEQNK